MTWMVERDPLKETRQGGMRADETDGCMGVTAHRRFEPCISENQAPSSRGKATP